MMDHKGDSTKRIAAEIAEDSELGHDSATLDLDPARRYKALLSVNNAIVSQTSCENLFNGLAREIRKIFHYDRFSICIYDPDSDSLGMFAMAEGVTVKDIDDGARPLASGPVAQAVITSRRPLIIPDMAKYSHWSTIGQMMEEGLRATMGFPLIARDTVVGTLHFSFKKPPAFIAELSEFLTDLSGQVALAVDNMLNHAKLLEMNARLVQQKSYLLKRVDSKYRMDQFYYSSPTMREIMRQVEIIADSDASVLITGETGTGKDYIAHCIHQLSDRRDAMFVKINCPVLSVGLFESELFGHAKGAYTGAISKRVGRFEMAHTGTVFLDEIGELALPLQAKLLQVLQDKSFERVGESHSIDADFRVIAATNNDLEVAIKEKNFRSDLFYRLNTVTFHIPPLRERTEEVEPLVRRFTHAEAEAMHRVPPIYSDEIIDILKRHSWPGNIRELKNIVSRLIIAFSGKTVLRRDIEPLLNIRPSETNQPAMTLAAMECAHLIKILTETKGVVGGPKGAASILKMPKSTLQYRLRKHGLSPRDFSR